MSNDDRDLREIMTPQERPTNPEETPEDRGEGDPGFGSAEFVMEEDEITRDESNLPDDYDEDDGPDLMID